MPKLWFYNVLHSRLVGAAGLERATLCLEGSLSSSTLYIVSLGFSSVYTNSGHLLSLTAEVFYLQKLGLLTHF